MLVLPQLGLLLKALIQLLVCNYKLPLYYLYVGEAINGTSGGFPLFLMAAFASAADTSSMTHRVRRISFTEGSLALGQVAGGLISGVLVRRFGFYTTFMATLGVISLSCILVAS